MPAGGVDDATLREALEAVGLPELAGRLDEAGHWALQLSPGEQQRIAFARALVQKPDWLFLDEATSAVDEATEARSIGWCASGSRRRRCSASAIGRRCAHSTRACSWCSPAGAAPRPSWRYPPRPTRARGTVLSGPTRGRRTPGRWAVLRAFGRRGSTRERRPSWRQVTAPAPAAWSRALFRRPDTRAPGRGPSAHGAPSRRRSHR